MVTGFYRPLVVRQPDRTSTSATIAAYHVTVGRRPAVDVLVIGGGNAALCAALAARQSGASVLLLEKTGVEWRGGNSKYTRSIRVAGPGYPDEEFLADLALVTGERLDRGLAAFTIERSREAPAWMERQGVRWEPAAIGTVPLSHTNRGFLGGGKALVNTYYRRARQLGVQVRYRAEVKAMHVEDGRCRSVSVEEADGQHDLSAGAVVVAAGGFESNLDWLRRYWGDAVDNCLVRGTRANDGRLLRQLLALGAMERGSPGGCHAVACDARSPRFEGGIVTRVDSLPLGIAVNRDGRRFADEGQDLWTRRYASWGALVARQPGQIAFSVFDRSAWGHFIPPFLPPYRAASVEALARAVGVDGGALRATVEEYNRAADGGTGWDPSRLDGRATSGLRPPKSNWAMPLERPPFFAYPLRPGITFTYLAVGVDTMSRVLDRAGSPFDNVFAAGEVMAGNMLLDGYLGGFGMTIGTVFGRIAGEEAAARARAA
jgi:tricarballylate dehydrogenase